MRDIVLMTVVVLAALVALRRPWVGVMLWTWVSMMNPHRFTYGFAYNMPVAAIAAGSTLLGFLLTRERQSPFRAAAPVWLVVFMLWITLSWVMGLDTAGDYDQWSKVMKIYVMLLVTLALLHTKEHIFAFVWVVVASLAFLGAKGGLFTILTAGSYRVYGPQDTFIAENNAFAVGIIMTIPLVRFLQLQLASSWGRRSMTVLMVLLAVCALGSQSRGALLSILAMSTLLWWRQKRQRVLGAVIIVTAGLLLVAFMPDDWGSRMSTIKTYDQDQSAMGRIAAWWVAWGIAFDYPFGVGFFAARPELFFKYSPYVDMLAGHYPVAHSIYFQMLGFHGFVGLGLFLMIWVVTWFTAARLRKQAEGVPQARWCADLAGMAQVSLIGYLVGGAFLDLAYFDLPYDIMAMVVLSGWWLRSRGWEREPVAVKRRWFIPGVAGPSKALTT